MSSNKVNIITYVCVFRIASKVLDYIQPSHRCYWVDGYRENTVGVEKNRRWLRGYVWIDEATQDIITKKFECRPVNNWSPPIKTDGIDKGMKWYYCPGYVPDGLKIDYTGGIFLNKADRILYFELTKNAY
jgi:hypothetical protein